MRRHAVATMLVGSNSLLREGLAHILCPPKFRVVASGPGIAAFDITALAQYQSILLIFESGDIPARAIEFIATFKRQNTAARVVVLGSGWRPPDIVAVFQAGANAYFAQVKASEEFLKTIELVMLGQTILPVELLPLVYDPGVSDVGSKILATTENDPKDDRQLTLAGNTRSLLSAREKSILHCIAQGASNKRIAREFDISEATVKVHVKTILRKVGVSNRTQAAIWAMSREGSIHTNNGRKMLTLASQPSAGWELGVAQLCPPNSKSEKPEGVESPIDFAVKQANG